MSERQTGETEVRVTIDQEGERLLTWYLGTGRAQFERSTFGAQLERAELFGHGSTRCMTCRGSGVINRTGDWCGRCKGVGAIHHELPRPTSRGPGDLVLKVSETHVEAGYVPNDLALMRYAVVSRRIGLLSPMLQSALAAYYGDAGIRCSSPPCWRMVALYPLTQAGRRLASLGLENLATDEERLKFETDPPYERCRGHVELERSESKAHRRALIETAEQQAVRLFERAASAWAALDAQEVA